VLRRRRHAGETYGSTLSELVMNGRMDLAVLYGGRVAVHGLLRHALAETINGRFKTEIIHRRRPWKTREAAELVTLEGVS
jgi:hypothetical protein